MNESEIFAKVKNIVTEQLSVEPDSVTPSANFADDLNADSLDTVELVMALEEKFNIEIPDEDSEKINTVDDVVKYIVAKTNRDSEIQE